jgi:hypothetical protein
VKERLDKKGKKEKVILEKKIVYEMYYLYQSKLNEGKWSGLSNVPRGTLKDY